MPKMDLACYILQQNHDNLSPIEKTFLEIKLVTHLYQELSTLFESRYQAYRKLIKLNQEEQMHGVRFIQELINDILSTQEYTLSGIATHTQIPEDVLLDLAIGLITNPTFDLTRKLFGLHITVRRDLYDQIMRKIALQYLVAS